MTSPHLFYWPKISMGPWVSPDLGVIKSWALMALGQSSWGQRALKSPGLLVMGPLGRRAFGSPGLVVLGTLVDTASLCEVSVLIVARS